MKMKLLDRILVRLGAFFILLCGALSIASGVVLFGSLTFENYLMYIPVALICAGALAVLFAVYFILLPGRYRLHRRSFVIQPTENGELRISIIAIENLIRKCVETHKEIKVQEMCVMNKRGSVAIELRVFMDSNVSIPHAIEQLQNQIKRYLAASSGIDVREISVSVERTTGDSIDIPAENMTNEPAAEQDEKATPVHQRLFADEEVKVTEQEEKPAEEQNALAEAPAAETAPEEETHE